MKNRKNRLAEVGVLVAALVLVNVSFVAAQDRDAGAEQIGDSAVLEGSSDLAVVDEPVAVDELLVQSMVSRKPKINAGGADAQLSIGIQSDSDKTSGRHYTVTRYLNEQCQRQKKKAEIFRKKYAKSPHNFGPIDIESGGEFLFQIDYLEKRRSGDRSCSTLIKFSPQAGQIYRFNYEVTGQVSRCSVTVNNVSTSDVQNVTSEDLPENSCKKSKVSGVRNGVPVHTVNQLY